MPEDGETATERRLSPRIKMTVRRHIAYWVAMSPARRIVASLGVAAIIGGTTFGACKASDFTGPTFKSGQPTATRTSKNVATSDGTIDDEATAPWPMAPARHGEMSPTEAENDTRVRAAHEASVPITERVYNACRNERPIVLNGFIKERKLLETGAADGGGHTLQQVMDTRGVHGTYAYDEDYWDDNSQSWKKRQRVVRYHNRENTLDRFEVGPAGLPFQSELHTRMHLQREGAGPNSRRYGDDLFVLIKQTVRIGKDGIPQTYTEFRSECK
jgi:hypothetical protein